MRSRAMTRFDTTRVLPARVGMRGWLVLLLVLVGCAGCADHAYVIGRLEDSSCAEQGSALVCSGFERSDLSDWDDVIVVNDAQVTETTANKPAAHGGKGELHASSSGAQSSAVVAREFEAVTSGELYLRSYLYVPSTVATETMNILFVGDFATPDPFQGVDFNLQDGALQIYVPGSQPDRTMGTLPIPRDRWFCLQVKLTVSNKAGAVQIDIDGAQALSQTGLDTLPDAGVHLLRAGVDWSSDQKTPFDVYMDDLVLSRTRVACE